MSLVCIGNRRSEQNAIQRTVGFSWGPGAISTTYMEGIPLRDVLIKAGVSTDPTDWDQCHVEFLGADQLPNKVGDGPFPEKWGDTMNYGTSVPLSKAMDPARDMMLAYKANGEYLPPDRGYPLRVVIPGSTGGRMVKWLKRITVLPHESHNMYHHHDNKILPPHVLDLKSSLDPEKKWWYKSEYIVQELNINSVICKPDHGDALEFYVEERDHEMVDDVPDESSSDEKKQESTDNNAGGGGLQLQLLDVAGYAYAGGGRRITRVEYSLDAGVNWDIATIERYEKPTMHDMHWCWIFWHTQVPASKLQDCKEIWVRAWDETNNTQPLEMTWNLMGLGNNQIFRVKVHVEKEVQVSGKKWITVTFEHPTQPGGIPGGWMKQSGGLPFSAGFGAIPKPTQQLQSIAEDGAPKQVYSKEEIARHNSIESPWIVVKGNVYDCTAYLQTHPGGKESILIYGGKDCTKDFEAVHSIGATELLKNYLIGTVEGYVNEDEAATSNTGCSDDDLWKIVEAVEDSHAPIRRDAESSLAFLDNIYGALSSEEDAICGGMDIPDAILVTEGWHRLVQNHSAFSEALLLRWRLLVAVSAITKAETETSSQEGEDWMERPLLSLQRNRKACLALEKNEDPLASALGGFIFQFGDILMALLNAGVASIQTGKNNDMKPLFSESYMADLGLVGVDLYNVESFAVLLPSSIKASDWVLFCRAFQWAVSTHLPGSTPADHSDLAKPLNEGAYGIFVSHRIARTLIRSRVARYDSVLEPPSIALQGMLETIIQNRSSELGNAIGQRFFTMLFESYPELFDYFPNSSSEWLASCHMLSVLRTVAAHIHQKSNHFEHCFQLDRTHLYHAIPPETYKIFGGCFLQVFVPFFEEEVKTRSGSAFPVTMDDLMTEFSLHFLEVIRLISPSMVHQQYLLKEAKVLIKTLANDLEWSQEMLEDRLFNVETELRSLQYVQQEEEIISGLQLAWRNSSDDANRIAWKEIIVIDKRHSKTMEELGHTVNEHLKLSMAEGRGKPQSIFTVMGAKKAADPHGLRYWGSKYFMYAGYSSDGRITGDPNNVEYTDYLIRNRLWKAPKEKGHFDLLPIVFKAPCQKPFAHTIPEELRFEVSIEHPTCAAISKLGLRWPALDFVSNVHVALGGVCYQCSSFNKVHVSSRVTEELLRWPNLVQQWAGAMGIAEATPHLKQKIRYELEVAILHSFQKEGYAIMDDEEASQAFLLHCESERKAGRYCSPHGRIGCEFPRNLPEFVEGCDISKVLAMSEDFPFVGGDLDDESTIGDSATAPIPKVLILYGSETGTGEQIARRLKLSLKVLRPFVMKLNEALEINKIVKENNISHVIAICSTVNRGEFPHNAAKFAETSHPTHALKGINFTICALGNSVYPNFCAAGVRLKSVFDFMGGTSFLPLKKIDGKDGSVSQIDAWVTSVIASLLPEKLADSLGMGDKDSMVYEMKWLDNSASSADLEEFQWSDSADTMVCTRNDELLVNGNIESRSTRRIDFKLPPNVSYESGDHLAVQPLNSLDIVKRFAKCFKTEMLFAAAGDRSCNPGSSHEDLIYRQLCRPFTIETFEDGERVENSRPFPTPCTLSDLLQSHADLTLHESQVAELFDLAKSAIWDTDGNFKSPDVAAKHEEAVDEFRLILEGLKSKKDGEKQRIIVRFLQKYPTIVDFLEHFEFMCPQLKLASLLQSLPRLHARYYSISSSPGVDPSTVSISVGVVRETTSAGTLILGVCSNYLARRHPMTDRVKVSVRSSSFRGPTDVTAPTIMVGPGTGLAPMMGFLEDRSIGLRGHMDSLKHASECHVFLGCRTQSDRIYSCEIDSWEKKGLLKSHLALSRSPDLMHKTYVQDLLIEMGEELYKFLTHPKASMYLCGDAKVGNAIFDACVECLRTHGHRTKVGAVQHLKIMQLQKRWQYDLWGTLKNYDDIGKLSKKSILKQSTKALARTWLENI